MDFNKEEMQVLDSAYLGEFTDFDHVDVSEVGGLYVTKRVWDRYKFFFEAFANVDYINRITAEFGVSRNTARKWISGDVVLQLIQRYCQNTVEQIKQKEREIERAKRGKRYKFEQVADLERARIKRLNREGKIVKKLY